MNTIDMDALARGLVEDYGLRATVIAAKRARAAEEKKNGEQHRIWRRIEVVLTEMHAAPES